MEQSYFIIDIQGFRDDKKKFILKEIAILSSTGELQHYIIRPPYGLHLLSPNTQKTNRWLQRNHHGFQWSDGVTYFHNVINHIKKMLNDHTKIYVKGFEKKEWITNTLKYANIIDLDNNIYSNIKTLKSKYGSQIPKCLVNHSGICAVQNVSLLKKYLEI